MDPCLPVWMVEDEQMQHAAGPQCITPGRQVGAVPDLQVVMHPQLGLGCLSEGSFRGPLASLPQALTACLRCPAFINPATSWLLL